MMLYAWICRSILLLLLYIRAFAARVVYEEAKQLCNDRLILTHGLRQAINFVDVLKIVSVEIRL